MLAVISSHLDSEATTLVKRWAAHGAAILTCKDLSRPGWSYFQGDKRSSRAVISGSVVPVTEIRGVLTRRPRIFEAELGHIAAADRAYVAAEMNAFLVCWLAALRVPVLNPPTATCLSGPEWGPQQWAYLAHSLGIPTQPLQWSISADREPAECKRNAAPATTVTVTVVDKRCFNAPDKVIKSQALSLAAAAGVRFLAVEFNLSTHPPVFQGARTFPKLADPAISDALLQALLPKRSRGTSRAGTRRWPSKRKSRK